jgi:hypothetical protein
MITTRGLAEIDLGRQPRQEIQFRREQLGIGHPRQELPDRFDVEADQHADEKPVSVPTTPIAAP